MINRKFFFDTIKGHGLFAILDQSQVDGMNAILDEYDRLQWTDSRHLAYILATVYHECGLTRKLPDGKKEMYRSMQPVEEVGKGKGRPYGSKIKMSRKPYTTPDQLYYGRGFVQITWYENYEKAGKVLNMDLLNNPELALQLGTATQILFQGMSLGWFTGRKLSHYFNKNMSDPHTARKIINGKDKADLIRGYYVKFLPSIKPIVAL